MPFRGVFPADRFVPAPYGLFSAADVRNHTGRDEHWAGGFEFESELCRIEGSVIDVCGGPNHVFVEPKDGAGRKIQPFGIRAKDACLSPGWSVQDRRARVLRQLEAVTQRAVEFELWAGTYSKTLPVGEQNPYLTSSDAVDVTGGHPGTGGSAVKPKVGIALLEQAIAECGSGGQGTIHAPASVGGVIGNPAEQSDPNVLTTFNGNKFVVGSGYDGRAPGANSAPTNYFTPWIYATGPVAVDLGPAELVTLDYSTATNARTNEMDFVAVRPAAVYWDGCCHFAVQVDIRS